MNKKSLYQNGFSLIELIVVLTITTLVIGTTTSIFVSMISNQNKILKEQELFSQISYAVENISRSLGGALRDKNGSCLGSTYTGYSYVLTRFDSLSGFYQGVKFLNQDSVCQEFFIDTDSLLKEKKGSSLAQKILSDNFVVEYARFVIDGNKSLQFASGTDLIQHRVTFSLKVKISDSQGVQERIIQTTVSPLELNIP